MNDDAAIQPITAEATRPLRYQILRPHQSYEDCIYPDDDAPNTLHLGAEVDGEIVGVCSFLNEPPPDEDDPDAWRVRGMAVKPDQRREGLGERIVERGLQHIREHSGSCVWFNARTSAVPFYEEVGFKTEGEEYDMPPLGPHYFMRMRLDEADDPEADS